MEEFSLPILFINNFKLKQQPLMLANKFYIYFLVFFLLLLLLNSNLGI